MALIGEDLGFYYHKDKWIFKEVSITVEPGEIMGLSGYSGCGKTTLARILAGYILPHVGRVTIDRKPIEQGTFRSVQLIHQHPGSLSSVMRVVC
ncbi:putative ABC transporter ATP-binding protein [compost metagenome]